MAKHNLTKKLFAAAVVLTAPIILHPSHARADEISRAISDGVCSDREECQESEGRGVAVLAGILAAGVGLTVATSAIVRANDPKRKKAKAEGPESFARYKKVVERAERISTLRVRRLQVEREQRLQAEEAQRNTNYQAEQLNKAEAAKRTKIEHANKRINQQRARRIERAPRAKKDNTSSPPQP